MDLKSETPLPILLISAADASAANTIISELTSGSVRAEGSMWSLSNKYYRADVMVMSEVDGGGQLLARDVLQRVEAHVVYVATNQGEDIEAAQRRFANNRDMASCQVRLLIADDDDKEDMTAWAWANGVEPIWRGGGEGEDMARAADALHAHCWSGYVRNENAVESHIDMFPSRAEMRALPREQRLLLAEMAMLHLQGLRDD